MKILVTGSQGFVGGHVFAINKHRFESHSLIGYDLVNGFDIRDKFTLDRVFESEGIEAVISLAARAGVRRGEEFVQEYFDTNVIGLANLIEISEKYKVKKFIHFSSSSAFGAQKEDHATREGDPKKPRSVYGITKLAGELLLEKSDLPYIIIRPFTLIGENGRKEMVVYKWLNQIKEGKPATFYGEGKSFRGYTYVGDIMDAIELILESDIEREDFNIGGRDIVRLEELKDIFVSVFPEAAFKILPMPKSDQMFSLADTSKAERMLGWSPKTDVREKIREILKASL